MKTLAILSQKGGTGKTTATVHLAVAAQQAGHNVAIIDLDPQANAVKWGKRRDEKPQVYSSFASLLEDTLHTAEQNGATLTIIDTQGAANPDTLKIAETADFALITSRPGMMDVEVMLSVVSAVKTAHIPAWVLFNAVRPNCSMLLKAKRAVKTYDLPTVPHTLGDRVAFSHPLIDGRTAQEYERTGKASQEIKAVYRYIAKKMGV